MFTVIKRRTVQKACRLGEQSPLLEQLLQERKIVPTVPGEYLVLSLETDGMCGQVAHDGDFIKVDTDGNAYPNDAEYFLRKHTWVGEDTYMQKTEHLAAWDTGETMCDEISFLIEKKGLIIDPQSRDKYFSAPLWGTMLYAAEDAVIIFYSISRDKNGTITDAEFNFIDRSIFDKTYERIG